MVVALLVVIVYQYQKYSREGDRLAISMYKAYNTVTEAVIIIDHDERVRYSNLSASMLLNCDLRSLIGKNFWDIFKFTDISSKRTLLNGIQALVEYHKDRLIITLQDKRDLSVAYEINKLNFSELGADSYILILKDISEYRMLESRLHILKTYDSLTHLPNRRAVESHIKRSIINSRKHNSFHVFCYISLDQLQYFIDLNGYSAGEELVKSFAEKLKSLVRADDVLAHINNGDFAILYHYTNPKPALKLISDVLWQIQKVPFKWLGHEHNITASIGFYLIHKSTYTATQVLYDAHLAGKIAKEKGGNRIYIFRQNDDDISIRKGNILWGRKLKAAFEDDLFHLFAQPIHPLNKKDYKKPFFHYEVLIRLHSSEGNWISPGEFLPAAEHHNMMILIDKWVVSEVIKQVTEIASLDSSLVFSINLSGQSLNDPHFLDYIISLLNQSAIDPRMLCFEITETVAVNELSSITRFIDKLRKRGCSFSLDDFGTGVSSYSYLKNLDVNYLKIDGSFVKDMDTDLISYEMVRSINQVGHAMGLEVIAEFVETEQVMDSLRKVGVEYGQGYGIARPEPMDGIIKRHISSSKNIASHLSLDAPNDELIEQAS